MKRSLVLCALFVGAVSQFGATEVQASVEGKTYDVVVRTSFTTTFDDTYTFFEDGSFTSVEGGTGSWTEFDLFFLAFWSASFGDGTGFEVDLNGLQVGTKVISFGSSTEGDFFFIQGTQHTGSAARKRPGSYRP